MKHIAITITILGLLFSLAARAQIDLNSAERGTSDSVELIASPASPSPGETVIIEALAPSFDKNTAYFEWLVNGVPQEKVSGQGENTLTLTAGDAGSSILVEVGVSRNGSPLISASIKVIVVDLALTWFAETYIPKWYKGRALPTPNSTVSVVALPFVIIDGKRIAGEDLIYRWSADDERNVVSGVGKHTLRIRTSKLTNASHNITVVVEDTEKRIRKEGFLVLPLTTPRIGFYHLSPLGGVEPRRALFSPLAVGRTIIDIIAEPFFFPVISRNDLSYRWNVSDVALSETPDNPYLLTLDTQNQNTNAAIPILVNVDHTPHDFVAAIFKSLTLIVQ